jgi:starch-binding outer membrane protein, SusD/RagB family
MKNIFYFKTRNFTVLLVALNFLASCKKLIEIPPAPLDKITEVLQLSDSANVMNAVAGVYVYAGRTGSGIGYSNAQYTIAAAHSADELIPGVASTTTATFQEFYDYGVSPGNTTISSLWTTPYSKLFPINTIINTIPASTNMSPEFIKRIVSEMKLMRALYYFDLVNQFGGVPLVLTTDYKTTALLPRASVDSVYNQIISDLTDARNNLQVTYPSPGKLRPNLYTALTLLSKVHLYRQDWQNAFNEADQIIKSGLYTLESDLNRVFVDGSTEAIWQIPVNSSGAVPTTDEAIRFITATATTTPNFVLTPFLLNALGLNVVTDVQSLPADQRLGKWTGRNTVTIAGVPKIFYYPKKYKNTTTTQTPVEDYMIFRLGEVYLIRAEAAARLGRLTEALADVNIIRARAGLPASTASAASQTAVLNAIMKERQTELFTEWGNRWYDLKRTGMAAAVLGTLKTGWQPNAALYPIPAAQLILGINLVQNPGY